MTRIYVPIDSAALALGAQGVAEAIASEAEKRGIDVQLVRNGSRGLFYLEPLVEVETADGRIGYSNVEADDVAALFDAGFHEGKAHEKNVGVVDEIPYLKNQQRLTFARIGITDPLSIDDYTALGGLEGLRQVLDMNGDAVCQALLDSGLRGRGGAAFPAGIKWKTVRGAYADQKYIVCNADEGDSGTFSDRLVMESDPYMLIEGMIIAGVAVGAMKGYIYVRSEYPHSIATLNRAIDKARDAGWLGASVLGTSHAFELYVAKGAGAYVCGEETALLESLEGKRGIVRAKPPVPALTGLYGKPTVINNVITLATVPIIFAKGAAFYRDFGMGRSRGTLPFQIAGNEARRARRAGVRRHAARTALYLRRRHRERPSGARGASGRAARHVSAGKPVGHSARLRGICEGRRGGRARRTRGSRRHLEPRRTRAIRDALLRARIVRQVHAMPHRLDARRGSHREDS